MTTLDELLEANPVIPVVVVESAEDGVNVGKALLAGGITSAEVTFRTAAAESAIAAMSELEGLTVGAGTVINVDQAKRAIAAGAKFVVSPGLSADVVRYCQEQGVPILPACTDGSLIMAALDLGIDTVKFFPATALGGIPTIKALAAPFPQVRFVPTGGVSAQNLADFLKVPAVASCGGSWMVKGDLVKNQDWDEISRLSAEAQEIAAAARAN